MSDYLKNQDVIWIVIAKDTSDLSEEIQFVTKDRQRAIQFVETNYCDFQEGVFDQVCIFPFTLDTYLGVVDDSTIENDRPTSNPLWEILTYSWDESRWIKTASNPIIFGGRDSYLDLLNQEVTAICRESSNNKN